MAFLKKLKDNIIKHLSGPTVPRGLFKLDQYFRLHHSITFELKKTESGIVAVSKNFKYGSIVTSGKNEAELDKNIKDAILTSFDVPSSYMKEASIRRSDEALVKQKAYVLA